MFSNVWDEGSTRGDGRTRRAPLRDVVGEGLAAIGATSPALWARGRLTVVTFHRVLPEDERARYPLRGLAVTPEELDWLLGRFEARFSSGPLGESVDAWLRGDEGPPRLAITFDDGQSDNFVHARPVLEARRVRATFFLPVASIESGQLLWHDRLAFALGDLGADGPALVRAHVANGVDGLSGAALARRAVALAKELPSEERAALVRDAEAAAGTRPPPWAGMLSWDDVRALAAAGHEIGSHSMSHPLLPECDDATLDLEVIESKRRLQAELCREVRSFCYPNGTSDARALRAVRRAGYSEAVTTTWGSNSDGGTILALRRFDMSSDNLRSARGALSASRLAWRMSPLHPRASR